MTPRTGSEARQTWIQVLAGHQFSGGPEACHFGALNHSFLRAPGARAAKAHGGVDVGQQLQGCRPLGKFSPLPTQTGSAPAAQPRAGNVAANSPCCRTGT